MANGEALEAMREIPVSLKNHKVFVVFSTIGRARRDTGCLWRVLGWFFMIEETMAMIEKQRSASGRRIGPISDR